MVLKYPQLNKTKAMTKTAKTGSFQRAGGAVIPAAEVLFPSLLSWRSEHPAGK